SCPVSPSALAVRLRRGGRCSDVHVCREVAQRPPPLLPVGVLVADDRPPRVTLGIGAGPFKVLGLDMVMAFPIKVSTATSNYMNGMAAAASAAIHFTRGDIRPELAATVALGVLAGARMGTQLLPRLPGKVIRYI